MDNGACGEEEQEGGRNAHYPAQTAVPHVPAQARLYRVPLADLPAEAVLQSLRRRTPLRLKSRKEGTVFFQTGICVVAVEVGTQRFFLFFGGLSVIVADEQPLYVFSLCPVSLSLSVF